ncbi:MAG: hypothetical protein IPG04_21445 [Polyangiaceae bacterium]|nr:hypothetical protein [Polyangiaceae bacterium]
MTSSSTPQRSQSSGMPDDPVETAGPEYTVNPRAGGENDVTCAGKYLLIGVPQFAQDPISGNLMTSYLRLGASSTTWEQDPGGWLAAKIHEHGPPGGHLTPDNQEVDTTAETRSPDRVFIDDDRNRVAGVAHGLSKAERLAQSRVIHTRGGWRDHSDGNRITTTYGDKIEVIRGNYKRIVLGRQDEATSSAGWDVSGQIIQDFAYMMPGASVRVEESSNYKDASGNNVWHLQNTMENIVQSTNVAGDFFEYKWGNKHYSYTGSENPTDKGPNSYPRQNPHILEKTWATKIEGYTGSSNKRIPEIYEETWATTVTSKENITTKNEESTVTTATSDTTVTTLTETTKVGAQVSTTFAGAVLDTTFVGAQNSTTIAGGARRHHHRRGDRRGHPQPDRQGQHRDHARRARAVDRRHQARANDRRRQGVEDRRRRGDPDPEQEEGRAERDQHELEAHRVRPDERQDQRDVQDRRAHADAPGHAGVPGNVSSASRERPTC